MGAHKMNGKAELRLWVKWGGHFRIAGVLFTVSRGTCWFEQSRMHHLRRTCRVCEPAVDLPSILMAAFEKSIRFRYNGSWNAKTLRDRGADWFMIDSDQFTFYNRLTILDAWLWANNNTKTNKNNHSENTKSVDLLLFIICLQSNFSKVLCMLLRWNHAFFEAGVVYI